MNLNNKYLAIGLSIAAVAIVSYQIFFSKTKTTVRRAAPPAGSAAAMKRSTPPPATPSPQTAARQQTNWPRQSVSTANPSGSSTAGSADNGLMIDFNSPSLLQRIPQQMAEKYPRREIPDSFGIPIFSRGIVQQKKAETPVPTREVEFKLNAIIIDQNRRIAIINDTIVKVDDTIAGAKVIAIVKSKVQLKINSKTIVLSTNSRIKRVKLIGGQGEE